MELRNWIRKPMELEVEIRLWRPSGDEILRCRTIDVSVGGACMLTHRITFPKHRVLEIIFKQLQDCELRQPRILGRYVRQTDDGIAIEFLKANNETIKKFYELISRESNKLKPAGSERCGLAS